MLWLCGCNDRVHAQLRTDHYVVALPLPVPDPSKCRSSMSMPLFDDLSVDLVSALTFQTMKTQIDHPCRPAREPLRAPRGDNASWVGTMEPLELDPASVY